MIHINVFGQHIIIINSVKVANELLEKRANIYSDKPCVPMVELTGWNFAFSFMPYNDSWRKHRRMFHQMFRREQITMYNASMTNKAQGLLRRLLDRRDDFEAHLYHWSAGSIMASVYGYEVDVKSDPFEHIAENALTVLARCMLPGSFAVNSLPFLQYLPEWIPGMSFKKVAATCHEYTDEMQDLPFSFTKRQVAERGYYACVVSNILENAVSKGVLDDEEEGFIKRIAAQAYAASYDTTGAAALAGIMALLLFPEVQQKALAEIHTVVCDDRLPDFRDRAAMPYAEALIREVLRWAPVTPMALPHRAMEDDVYSNYYIPRGAVIFGNAWGMLHNEETYEDPERFMPERWMNSDGSLKDEFPTQTFGFGRRLCAGRHMAVENIWIVLVSIIAAFDIRKSKDEKGSEIEVTPQFSDGWLCHPLPFKCSITPRNPSVAKLVREYASMDQ